MPYKVTKTVLTKTDLISECTPCHGIGKCIGPACKLYQVSKFLDMSCAYLFYDQTDKVIEFFKGDIDIEVVEDIQASEDTQTPEESNTININLSSSTPNKNASFTSKDATIVDLNGKTLVYNNGKYNMVDVSDVSDY